MKRSEVVNAINELFMFLEDTDPHFWENIGNNVLELVEEMGMVPPAIPHQGMGPLRDNRMVNKWEPETIVEEPEE